MAIFTWVDEDLVSIAFRLVFDIGASSTSALVDALLAHDSLCGTARGLSEALKQPGWPLSTQESVACKTEGASIAAINW